MFPTHFFKIVLLGGAIGVLSACGVIRSSLPSSGPSLAEVTQTAAAAPATGSGIQLVDISTSVAERVRALQRRGLFSESWGQSGPASMTIGTGDTVEVLVWEAPPASLFGAVPLDTRTGSAASRSTALPEQMVNSSGFINVPFVGTVRAAGRTPQEMEADIIQRLKGKANQPQVLVRITRNASSNVTVIGEVAQSLRMPLTARGERLLDALAAAGGVRQPVGKMTLQITRGQQVLALPLDAIIVDPRQNIVLQPGDVVTALFQPFSLTVLGATGRNEEMNFEGQGITLAQALGRAGGLQDARADARGVFVFRLEEPQVVLPLADGSVIRTTAAGKVPVVYRMDLKDPSAFFVAQDFPMRNKDVLFVSNAPAAELQKFLGIIGSVVGPIAAVRAITQ